MKQEVIEFLPQLIKDVVIELEESEGLPPEMSLPTILSIINFATQSKSDGSPLLPTWKRCPTGQYYCVLAESGQRKTATFEMLSKGVKKWEKEQVLQAKQRQSEYEIAQLKYKADLRERAKDDTNSLPPITEPSMYRNWKHVLQKFTTNGLLNDLERIPHAFLVNTDAAEFFNSHAFQSKSGTDTEIVTVLSKLWSNEPITKSTGIEEKHMSDRRATALFMIQAGQAKFLKDARYKDQGFTNRVLIAQPPVIKQKTVSLFDQQNTEELDMILDQFNEHIYHLLTQADSKTKTGLANLRQELLDASDPNELDLTPLPVSQEAKQIFNEMYIKVQTIKQEQYYKEEGFFEEYKTFLSRVYEHFIRMATTIALFSEHEQVTIEDAAAAYQIIDWFIEERRHLELDIARDKHETVQVAEDLYKRLRKWQDYPDQAPKLAQRDMQERGGITKTCLNNNSIASYKNMNEYERSQVLNEMQSRDWVELINLDKGGIAIKVVNDKMYV